MKRKPSTKRHKSRPPRPRSLHIRSELREEPDLKRIAQTIFDLSYRLVESGKTPEQHEADMKKHWSIYRRLAKAHRNDELRKPLPGCACMYCTKQRGSLLK